MYLVEMENPEVWFRGIQLCVRELVEEGITKYAFDRGTCVRLGIEPWAWARLHIPIHINYRLLMFGDQGTAELSRDHSMKRPKAVYPTWEYGFQTLEELEGWMAVNPANDPPDQSHRPPDERWVVGQEHRVVVINPPSANESEGGQFIRLLTEMQEDYPDCILHLHGLTGISAAFRSRLRAIDLNPVIPARHGAVSLPNGKRLDRWEDLYLHEHWARELDFLPSEMAVPRNRCLFNIRAGVWAGKHFHEDYQFKISSHERQTGAPTVKLNEQDLRERRSTRRGQRLGSGEAGDKYHCDHCTLAIKCKLYREGSVCSLPDSETMGLARFFETRDSDTIMDGLQTIMGIQAHRVTEARDREIENEETDPNVTKMLDGLFNQGVKLAKLVDPSLRGPLVAIQNNNVGAINTGRPAHTTQELASNIMAELEEAGARRDQITETVMALWIQGKKQEALAAIESGGDVAPPAADVVDAEVVEF